MDDQASVMHSNERSDGPGIDARDGRGRLVEKEEEMLRGLG